MRPKKAWASKEDLVRQVDELRASGMSVNEACEKVGCNFTYYYSIKRELKHSALDTADTADTAPIEEMSFEEFVRLKREYEAMKRRKK